MTKLCENCGREFGHGMVPAAVRRQSYCSRSCANAKNGAVRRADTGNTKPCLNCGEPFGARLTSAHFDRQRFCSRRCGSEWNRPATPAPRTYKPRQGGPGKGWRRIPDGDIQAHFWGRVQIGADDDCWPYRGSLKSNGYGSHVIRRRTYNAHRLAWQFTHGDIPNDLCVCHACDNRRCCNPSHLWLGTASENMQDMVAKGRHGTTRQPQRVLVGGAT